MAVADGKDPDHEACVGLLADTTDELRTTALVVAESGWFIERQLGPGAEVGFCKAIVDGEFAVEDLEPGDWQRVRDLTEKYADNGLGGVDSSLIAVAERLNLDTVATLDHRHFRAVRPKHVAAFNIVP